MEPPHRLSRIDYTFNSGDIDGFAPTKPVSSIYPYEDEDPTNLIDKVEYELGEQNPSPSYKRKLAFLASGIKSLILDMQRQGVSSAEILERAQFGAEIFRVSSQYFMEDSDTYAKLSEWGRNFRDTVGTSIDQFSVTPGPIAPLVKDIFVGAGIGAAISIPVARGLNQLKLQNIETLVERKAIDCFQNGVKIELLRQRLGILIMEQPPNWEGSAKETVQRLNREAKAAIQHAKSFEELKAFAKNPSPAIRTAGAMGIGALAGGAASALISVILTIAFDSKEAY